MGAKTAHRGMGEAVPGGPGQKPGENRPGGGKGGLFG